jgi:cytochrome c peroxidase
VSAAENWKRIGPVLHALSSRPPYFHNGSARALADVVKFYDTRFT